MLAPDAELLAAVCHFCVFTSGCALNVKKSCGSSSSRGSVGSLLLRVTCHGSVPFEPFKPTYPKEWGQCLNDTRQKKNLDSFLRIDCWRTGVHAALSV